MSDKYTNVVRRGSGLDYAGDNDIDRATSRQRAITAWTAEREGRKAGAYRKSSDLVGKRSRKRR